QDQLSNCYFCKFFAHNSFPMPEDCSTAVTAVGGSFGAVLFAKRRNNRRRAWARTSGAEMWHGQNSPTPAPAWRKWMAELSLCLVNLTESNSRTVWSYKIAGTAAP